MNTLQEQLTQAQRGMDRVAAVVGRRFSSGREERAEPLAHLSALKSFVPQLEHAFALVQQLPPLLRLVSDAGPATRAKTRLRLAGVAAAHRDSEKGVRKAKARIAVSAWQLAGTEEGSEAEQSATLEGSRIRPCESE